MILTRSPLRITLGGGGTDLPSYYREHEGFLIAAAIDKYVYVSMMRPFTPGVYLKYSALEHVPRVEDIRHPIIREALTAAALVGPQIEITTLADIPAGTGLGSSGSFTTALLKALAVHRRSPISAQALAEAACEIEIERLRRPVGKQDPYIAAHGGLTCFTFHRDGRVTLEPLAVTQDTLQELEDSLLLFFTGFTRDAARILEDQHQRSLRDDQEMLVNLHHVKELGYRSREALESGHLARFGELMHEHWERKRQRAGNMTNPQIDAWYRLALANGAVGGKLVGAGGGGFLLLYAANRTALRRAMRGAGLQEVRFRFDFEGTKVVLS
jgi:D-glycero-alpha-D-manno-heptose-7-phosphate kinase